MEQDCISRAIEWLYAENNFKDYIWSVFISLISVGVAYFIFIMEVKNKERDEKRKFSNIRNVVINSLRSEIELSLNTLKEIKKDVINSEVDDVSKFKKYHLENIYLDNVMSIDIALLYSSCHAAFKDFDKKDIVSFLSNVKDFINRFSFLSLKQDEFFSSLNFHSTNLNSALSNLVLTLTESKVKYVGDAYYDEVLKVQNEYVESIRARNPSSEKSTLFIEKKFVEGLLYSSKGTQVIRYPEIYLSAKACLKEIESIMFIHKSYVNAFEHSLKELEGLLEKLNLWEEQLIKYNNSNKLQYTPNNQ